MRANGQIAERGLLFCSRGQKPPYVVNCLMKSEDGDKLGDQWTLTVEVNNKNDPSFLHFSIAPGWTGEITPYTENYQIAHLQISKIYTNAKGTRLADLDNRRMNYA